LISRRAFQDGEALAAALAERVAGDLRAGLEARGRASLALSGGSTPKRFFKALSGHDLDWPNVEITLVDERWVPPADERSNEALVRAQLMQDRAADARFVPLYTGDETPEAGLAGAEARVGAMMLPFDAAILGMGTDGHTASFFPGGDNLDAALDEANKALVVAMHAPGAGEPRITLTRRVLLQSHALYLHIEGAEKAAVLKQALGPGPFKDMPVRAMLQQDLNELVIFYAP
jgi:6-phosphogluconolactonase